MWPFSPSTKQELTEDEHAVLQRLIDRMDQVEHDASKRELEWTMWYDKFRTLFARIAKRAERVEQAEEEAPEAPGSTIRPKVAHDVPPIPFRSRRAF